MDPQQRLLPDALHAASLEGGHRHSRLGAPSVSLCAADTLERKVPRRRRRPLEGCAAVSCRLHETRLWSRRRRGRRRSSWPPRSGRRQHCPIGLPAARLTARAARRRGHVRRSLRVGVPRRAGMALQGEGEERGARARARSEGEGERALCHARDRSAAATAAARFAAAVLCQAVCPAPFPAGVGRRYRFARDACAARGKNCQPCDSFAAAPGRAHGCGIHALSKRPRARHELAQGTHFIFRLNRQ
mmetsp:Transcript_2021/g.6599  ORF Transcript_2021/g.6599 Transcript_2021/m.6599 type:complete len:245 (+) Transcript_2021:330-1064(+)